MEAEPGAVGKPGILRVPDLGAGAGPPKTGAICLAL